MKIPSIIFFSLGLLMKYFLFVILGWKFVPTTQTAMPQIMRDENRWVQICLYALEIHKRALENLNSGEFSNQPTVRKFSVFEWEDIAINVIKPR
jgi:hypothetical protein